MPNGAGTEALPDRVPPPTLRTVKVRSALLPNVTEPKFCEDGETLITGGEVITSVTLLEVPPLPPTVAKVTVSVYVPTGRKFAFELMLTITVVLAPGKSVPAVVERLTQLCDLLATQETGALPVLLSV